MPILLPRRSRRQAQSVEAAAPMASEPVLKPLLGLVQELEPFHLLLQYLEKGESLLCRGVLGPARPPLLAALAEHLKFPVLWVTPGQDAAERLHEDLALYGTGSFLFPERDRSLGVDPLRMELLEKLESQQARVVVASLRALLQKTLAASDLHRGRLDLRKGETTDLTVLLEVLVSEGYTRVPMVERRGEISLRGGILDVYPATDEPVRIELFGDEIESIRRFDKDTQRSLVQLDRIVLLPAREEGGSYLTEHFPRGSVVLLEEIAQLRLHSLEVSQESESAWLQEGEGPREEGWRGEWGDVLGMLTPFRTVTLTGWDDLSQGPRVEFPFQPQSVVPGRVEGLFEKLPALQEAGHRVVLISRQQRRLAELFTERRMEKPSARVPEPFMPGQVTLLGGAPSEGFRLELAVGPVEVFSDHEMMGTPRVRRSTRKADRSSLVRLNELQEDSLVVHLQHGIGRYKGVKTLELVGVRRDLLQIEYARGDTLYVPVEQLDLVQRYQGIEEKVPSLSRMGGQDWRNTRTRVREEAERIARQLLELYARREMSQGTSYPPDTTWQLEMEEAFPYQETPDQVRVIQEVKADMEGPRPMDRLVCGDVGYGKTEVALRAAFKAVMDSRQVAVLVPTTVLAHQHFQTFSQRLAPFPVRVEMLSRFCSPAETRAVLKAMEQGEVDVVIGTHRLLSKDIKFQKLGLLVVDEEHRFGVQQKERIKELRAAVDILTLTATPIPRTLHMSTIGVRDMSIIETPPEDRLPIKTYLFEFHPEIVKGAITRELSRGGQVFFVHNRVQGLERLAQDIRRLLPQARIGVGHGQMEEGRLEKVMMDFLEGEYDVLCCTTIIESGIDIPNVNTIIIHNAHAFGLSQLYQLRGRVGRSSRQAYCYLLNPPSRELTPEAEKRLATIRDFTHLGAGYQIALRDLEIRGAGDLLGAEQSGHIASVGFDLYCRLLGDAVKTLRGEKVEEEELSAVVELPIPASLPEEYVSDSRQKVALYKRIAGLRSDAQRQDLEAELRDRFGPLPVEAQHLLEVVDLRMRARELEIPSIRAKEGRLTFLMPFYPELSFSQLKSLGQATGWKVKVEQKALVCYGLCGIAAGAPVYPPPAELLEKVRGVLDRLRRWKEGK
ncbi:transcription-repair coupling factor [bacterium CPR1]|nr:transcription-repair coupling factor [bacterium CPR1]